jgi:hypothetical protein
VPFAQIASNSLLLTPTGWIRASKVSGEAQIAGVDRHGRLGWSGITAASSSILDQHVVVCSGGSVGQFSGSTALLLSNGDIVSASEMLSGADNREVKFETADCRLNRIDDELWISILDDLRNRSPFVGHIDFALRCHGIPHKTDRTPGVRVMKVGSHAYAVLNTMKIRSSTVEHFCDLVKLLFGSSDPEVYEFEVRDDLILNAYVSICGTDGISLECDSLQHTSLIRLCHNGKRPGPYLPLRTCFRAAEFGETHECNWFDPSWKPIVNGFLIAPSSIVQR